MAEIIRTARKEGFIDSIKKWCWNVSFVRCCSYADRQGKLF
ncbi:hypothetical protein [Pseudomonas rhodesiae]|nr:hypothetical protein [Pseudomonas rhodesiae]MCP1515557.1 hypothetical protein [Pseudomonas rhodesiae]MDF9772960.1 hypothetical protein [Pseudomonas rhodesiae]